MTRWQNRQSGRSRVADHSTTFEDRIAAAAGQYVLRPSALQRVPAVAGRTMIRMV